MPDGFDPYKTGVLSINFFLFHLFIDFVKRYRLPIFTSKTKLSNFNTLLIGHLPYLYNRLSLQFSSLTHKRTLALAYVIKLNKGS